MDETATVMEPVSNVRRRAFLGAAVLGGVGAAKLAMAQEAAAAPNPLDDPRTRLAHLLRRAGLGASPAEFDQFYAMGYHATIDWLLNYEGRNDVAEDRLAAATFDFTKREDLKRWWVVRMLTTNRPLQEKMVLFWHGLLTSGLGKVNDPLLMLRQNEFLRRNALGNFQTILAGITKDAAMLLWLDGHNSRKRAPNENYARELMELFTMGRGHYTEDDVKEAARAFTGWSVNRETREVSFNPKQFDDGQKTFLGRTGRWDANDIVDILVHQRATAEYISRRLFQFFAYREPSEQLVGRLGDVFEVSGFNIKQVVRAILLSNEFTAAPAYRALVKSPVELVVGTYRTLGLESTGDGLAGLMRAMGQDLFDPPNVAGWPGGAAWLNSNSWLQRVNFVNGIATRRKGDAGSFFTLADNLPPRQQGDQLMLQLVDGNLEPAQRSAVESYVYGGPAATLNRTFANRQGRDLAYLLMASPEYQLA